MNDIFIVDSASFEDVKLQLLKYLDALQKGSCASVDSQRPGDVNMVTFTDSEGYHPGDDAEDNGGYAVVVNGHSLVHALHPQLEQLFLELASQCKFLQTVYVDHSSIVIVITFIVYIILQVGL